jgi:hypothetical protein
MLKDLLVFGQITKRRAHNRKKKNLQKGWSLEGTLKAIETRRVSEIPYEDVWQYIIRKKYSFYIYWTEMLHG